MLDLCYLSILQQSPLALFLFLGSHRRRLIHGSLTSPFQGGSWRSFHQILLGLQDHRLALALWHITLPFDQYISRLKLHLRLLGQRTSLRRASLVPHINQLYLLVPIRSHGASSPHQPKDGSACQIHAAASTVRWLQNHQAAYSPIPFAASPLPLQHHSFPR